MHIPFFIVPVLFILIELHRIFRHWSDGTERTKFYASRLIIKILASILSSILELLHILDLNPQKYYQTTEELLRTTYFLTSAFAWLFGAFIIYFKYNRRIKSQWFGQRGYWVLTLFSNSGLLILNIFTNDYTQTSYPISSSLLIQTIICCFSIFISIVMSYFAFFYPNDFIVIRREKQFGEGLYPKDPGEEREETFVSVQMAGYKIKHHDSTTTVQYDIIVSLNGNTHKVSRTYPEFSTLHKTLLLSYASDPIGTLKLPNFPNFLQKSTNMEDKTHLLGEYLQELCREKQFSAEVLVFLKLEGKLRESMLPYNNRLNDTQNETIHRSESTVMGYFDPKPALNDILTISIPAYHLNWIIDIHIPTWKQAESHIEYVIKSEIRVMSFESLTYSRFSEIFTLHKQLKKLHIPIPPFPSKNFHQNLSSEELEIRRSQLEEYLGTLMNDPAYLTQCSLNFIECSLKMNRILNLIPSTNIYELVAMTWEGEIGTDSTPFILYRLKFNKTLGSKTQEWEICRRYREFGTLHKVLTGRNTSFLLREYLRDYLKSELIPLPQLPGKSLAPLCTSQEIEARKRLLESYLMELLRNPAVTCCYYFRNFIGELE